MPKMSKCPHRVFYEHKFILSNYKTSYPIAFQYVYGMLLGVFTSFLGRFKVKMSY